MRPLFVTHFLVMLSGAAALGYQLIWARMFSTGLGHEMPALLAIVCAFMAGMAAGAWAIDRWIPRGASAGRWFAGLELAIGFWAVAASFLIPHVNDWALRAIGIETSLARHWFIAFAVPALTLLPATAAMGATFPAMEKFLSALAPTQTSLGGLYAANTFGAVAGTLLTPFLLMPALGFSRASWVLAAGNIIVAFGVWALGGASPNAVAGQGTERPLVSSMTFRRIAASLFVTGLLSIGFEVAGVRVLAQVLEGTIFTYAVTLAVFLLGTSAGAASYHRWWRGAEPQTLLARLLALTAFAVLLGVLALAFSQKFYAWARQIGDSPPAIFAAELLSAGLVFTVPSFCMGALFSHLVGLARIVRGRIGHVVALNTLGAALAPVVVVILLPLLGAKWALISIALAYLALLPRRPRIGSLLLPGCALAAACFISLRFVDVVPGAQVLTYREGVMASVAVVAERDGARTLRVDNRYQMGGTAAADAEYRQAHLPLLLHGEPRRALFLGLGTGISFGAAALYPELRADGVELVPEVVEAMEFFAPENFAPHTQPNLRVHVADARRFVRSSDQAYDVIVADLFHPYRDGAGALYTREHFTAVRARLAPGGIFCQWLPLHQLDTETLRVIVRTVTGVFPDAQAWLLRFNVDVPVIGLLAREGSIARGAGMDAAIQSPELVRELQRLGLADPLRRFGHVLADASGLTRFAGAALLNTDDQPRVTFTAPQLAYQRSARPYESLMALMRAADAAPLRLEMPKGVSAPAHENYLAARNVYLRGLIHDAEGEREQALAAYLESARLSTDFTAGYAQCLAMANALRESQPQRAREILEKLAAAQPERPVARELLERLFRGRE